MEPTTGTWTLLGWLHKGHLASTQNEFRFHSNRMAQALGSNTIESPLDCKEIQPVHSEGDQSWVFFGRNDAKAETPVLWPPHAKSWLLGKDSDAGRDWGQEEKGMTEDEMAGWHHWLDGHKSEWTPGAGDGQWGLACCDSWGRKESDTTEQLNWTELNWSRCLESWSYMLHYTLEIIIKFIKTNKLGKVDVNWISSWNKK